MNSLTVTVTGTVNAGICISFPNGRRIWFDLYPDTETPMFSFLKEDQWEAVKKDPRLTPPDLVFFTHIHPDHFSAPRTQEVNRLWPEVPVYLPQQNDRREAERISGLSYIPLTGEEMSVSLDGITVKAFRTIHSGQMFLSVPHYSFLISFEGKHIFLSGDALLTSDDLTGRLECVRTDLAILTFPWASVTAGRDRVEYAVQPEHVFLYHIPNEEKNRYCFREAAVSGSQLLNVPDVRLAMQPFTRETFIL